MSTITQSPPIRRDPPWWVVLLAIPLFGSSLVLAIFAGVGGVGWIDAINASREVTHSVPLAAGGTVTVDASSAAVVIEAGPSGKVSVADSMYVSTATRGLARAALSTLAQSTITATDGGATVAVPTSRNTNFAVLRFRRQVTVQMPADAPLALQGQAVGADIRDLRGTLNLNVGAGAIRLTNVAVNGSDRITATAGAIDFEGSLAGGSLDIETESGAIRLALPRGTNATYDVAASSGAIFIQPQGGTPIVSAGSDRSATGVLGAGGGTAIKLRANSGAISIRVG
jgi:hypothetical protein